MLIGIIAAAALPVAQPTALEAANLADVRCAAVFAVGAGQADATNEQAQGTTGGFMYYIGRIDARIPGYDLKAALERVLSAPDYEAQFPKDAERCGAEMARRGGEIAAIGQTLQALAGPDGAQSR